MATAALVKVEDVITSMGLAIALEDELTDTITSAAIKAMFRLETELECRLLPHSVVEVFNCDLDPFCGVTPNKMINLRLSNIYLSSSPAPVVSVADAWNGTYSTVDLADYLLDRDRGLLLVPTSYEDRYVKITYNCGFAGPADVPEIIKQGLLTYIPSIFHSSQTTTDAADNAPKYAETGVTAAMIITRLKRQMPICIRPMSYVATLL